ncbi:MAG TPA: chaperone NapD [Kiloniellales bacterium]|nr:chaperone NapD [Kiloniellales bacterium]
MAAPQTLDRRSFLKGRTQLHVASAVVLARPGDEPAVRAELGRLRGVEVHAASNGRLVVVIEGDSSGDVGRLLAQLSAIRGVIAANLVYEEMMEQGRSAGDGS